MTMPPEEKTNEPTTVPFDINELAGIEKAAIVLLSLSEEDAGNILRYLEPIHLQTVSGVMTQLSDLSQEKVTAVYRSFLEEIQNFSTIGMGREDFVRKTLTSALGEETANSLVDQILLGAESKGLDVLKWMEPRQVASIIMNEHPQIQTIILSYLEPEASAEILAQFSERDAVDLIMRIATLEEVQPAALHELNIIMEKQFAGQAGGQAAKIGGLKAAADIMNYMDNALENNLMTKIESNDEDMALQIQDLMFVFDNLIDVDDRGMQTLMRDIPQEILIKALKGTDEPLREKIYANMSKRAAEMLQDDLEAMGPIRIADVEAAQKEILSIARKLSESGEIMLASGGGDEFV